MTWSVQHLIIPSYVLIYKWSQAQYQNLIWAIYEHTFTRPDLQVIPNKILDPGLINTCLSFTCPDLYMIPTYWTYDHTLTGPDPNHDSCWTQESAFTWPRYDSSGVILLHTWAAHYQSPLLIKPNDWDVHPTYLCNVWLWSSMVIFIVDLTHR